MRAADVLMEGVVFGESPRWHDGRLWFSDWGANQVIALGTDGSHEVVRTAKVPGKVISEILGHASTSFTDDVYTVVAEELAEEAALAISQFVSRRDQESVA